MKIGILGGGQLGRMLIFDAQRLALCPTFVGTDANPSLLGMGGLQTGAGDLSDAKFVYSYGKDKDVITTELEHVSVDGLQKLEEQGVFVAPSSRVIQTIQDKSLQKEFYHRQGIPTLPFTSHIDKTTLEAAIVKRKVSFPFVWKAARGGYDGRGVRVIREEADMKRLPNVPCISEKFLPTKREIAVIVARTKKGKTALYPPVEMEFEPEANLISLVSAPAQLLDDAVSKKVFDATLQIAEKIDIVGTLAVEFFLDQENNIYVNESAPRVHNSGHWTMNGAETSQFEQHWRAILDMPLGGTQVMRPTVMFNLLGSKHSLGDRTPKYKGLFDVLKFPSVYMCDYGKSAVRPYRKMGHINVCRDSITDAYSLAKRLFSTVEVTDN